MMLTLVLVGFRSRCFVANSPSRSTMRRLGMMAPKHSIYTSRSRSSQMNKCCTNNERKLQNLKTTGGWPSSSIPTDSVVMYPNSLPRFSSRSQWISSCRPSYFTTSYHLDARSLFWVQDYQQIRPRPVVVKCQDLLMTRPRLENTIIKLLLDLPLRFQRTYQGTCQPNDLSKCRSSRSSSNSFQMETRGDENQGQEFPFELSSNTMSLLISALFLIYYWFLWRRAYEGENNELYTVASCLSQRSASNDAKVFHESKASDLSTSSKAQNNSEFNAQSSGKIQGRVDETDVLTFAQAVGKVDELLQKLKAEVGSPGIVVCVSVDGQYVYERGFGYADLENHVAIHSHSVIRIASISKAMTAVIVAKLVDEGKINLDQSIHHYLPSFPAKDFKGEKVDITVRQLLNHTSGIRSYWLKNDPVVALQPQLEELMSKFDTGIRQAFYTNVNNLPKKQTDKQEKKNLQKEENTSLDVLPPEYYLTKVFSNSTEALEMFSEDRLVAKPGTRFVYSTLAYTLLAAVVEAVTKKSFSSVAQETFTSWGMKETYLDENDPLIYNRVRHYQKKRGDLVNTPHINVSYKWAGGGFLSSVTDIVKFGNILLYSSQHGDNDSGLPGYLKQSTVQEFWTSIENKRTRKKYGLGFELFPSKKAFGMCPIYRAGAGHSGAAVGASSDLFILPRSHSWTKDDNKKRNEFVKVTQTTSHPLEESSDKCSSSQTPPTLPQGVVVAVMVNLIGVGVRDVTEEIAFIFDRVVMD